MVFLYKLIIIHFASVLFFNLPVTTIKYGFQFLSQTFIIFEGLKFTYITSVIHVFKLYLFQIIISPVSCIT